MSELNVSKASVLDRSLDTYEDSDDAVESTSLDNASAQQNETVWTFSNARRNIGYYKNIPELKKAIDMLAVWAVGQGIESDAYTEVITDYWKGWGEDCLSSILWNMLVMKKVVGDSFAEIIKEKDYTGGDRIINLKPISPERMRIVCNKKGKIIRYEQLDRDSKEVAHKFKPEEIFHLCNDRVGDEIHGTSAIDSCLWVINARQEALTDYRKVLHRNVIPVRIIEIDSDDTTKINALKAEYKDAIQKGEVLVVPRGTVTMSNDQITIENPIAWIQSLENLFYQAVGIPRVIATSQDYTEAGSKVGYLTFEPIYTWEQKLLEKDIWNQLNIRIQFTRPPSLQDNLQTDETKNTGQTSIQPKEASINTQRE